MKTTKELKAELDVYISKLTWVDSHPGKRSRWWEIRIGRLNWVKLKYSCTEDEKDLSFRRGRLIYKGFELKAV